MTSSAAGIYGNFGQANYSMAKMGIYGLCRTLSAEGARDNIHTNTIAPIAASRLAAGTFPDEILDAIRPEYISPIAAYLCHDSCEENGSLFEVGAGWAGKLRWERSLGYGFPLASAFSPADVRDRWQEITDFSNSTHPENGEEAIGAFVKGQMDSA